MNKVREIIRLYETAGLSIRQISKAGSVSRPVVDHYLKLTRYAEPRWGEIEPMDDEELLERLEAGLTPLHFRPKRRKPTKSDSA